jgi:hypothetical protein
VPDRHAGRLANLLLIAVLLTCCSPRERRLTGIVSSETGPIPGAVVRFKAQPNAVLTDEAGAFSLPCPAQNEASFVTAWSEGYFINGVEAAACGHVTIELHAHPAEDNPDYRWLSSYNSPGDGEHQGCEACHSSAGTDLGFPLPLDDWQLDAHSQSAVNHRFLTMYAGTDVFGNRSPLTRYFTGKDYGTFPLRPDPELSYYGPGYLLDFPQTAGNCAACHTPVADVDNPYRVSPLSLTGVAAEGISCDFCHKIWEVVLNDEGLPWTNMPGVLSYEFRRPPDDHQFFAGPLDDVAPGEDTYSRLQKESAYCAGCHYGLFWDTLVYNSYGEWLESSYSDPDNGKTCQDCHMPPTGGNRFATVESGSVVRDPETIHSHKMLGITDETFMQDALAVEVAASHSGDQIVVSVTILNDNTGHHVPTDSPLRQLILVVEAQDQAGNPLPLLQGSTLPEWTGVGDPEQGYFAGLPGEAYAKILQETWTEVFPSGAYWMPTAILSDNRIPALAKATSEYQFLLDQEGPVQVTIRLFYRRAFIDLADQKGWEDDDLILYVETIIL